MWRRKGHIGPVCAGRQSPALAHEEARPPAHRCQPLLLLHHHLVALLAIQLHGWEVGVAARAGTVSRAAGAQRIVLPWTSWSGVQPVAAHSPSSLPAQLQRCLGTRAAGPAARPTAPPPPRLPPAGPPPRRAAATWAPPPAAVGLGGWRELVAPSMAISPVAVSCVSSKCCAAMLALQPSGR